ncbi:MAG: chromosomal replication initiator protein DnaA [Bacilli bacterium]|nr:chromosomal replication initiator protein DnaA [Bacilli bacterium]
MSNELLWNKFLEQVKSSVNSMVYSTWFSKTYLVSIDNNKATIVVPLDIHKKRLSESYGELITSILTSLTGNIYDLEFVLEKEVQIKKETPIIQDNQSINLTPKFKHESNLNPKYTFDTFIVGNSNKLAHAAALAVAESPGLTYNPLFIYGNSGLGKTHLMQSIGNYIQNNSQKRVLYVTSEQFISDFSGIARKDNPNTSESYNYVDYFKDKYRNIDVLIIDDIQFLAGATQTQQEFFHTFNTLHQDKKQIIISSDRSPNDLKLLEDRLRTRFCWGLTVDIYPPDLELRINILKKKIEGNKIDKDIPLDVLEYIASNMTSDVRQLEGAINRLLAYSTIMGGAEINLSLAIDALKDFINKGTSEKTNISKVQKVVADFFQISVDDLKGKKRSSSVAFPRQIAMYLSRDVLNESFQRIGLEFGGRDHSTVMHSCEKIESDIKSTKSIRETVDKIKKNIN